MEKTYQTLLNRITFASKDVHRREMWWYLRGQIKMAFELDAITPAEFVELTDIVSRLFPDLCGQGLL